LTRNSKIFVFNFGKSSEKYGIENSRVIKTFFGSNNLEALS